jgi:hypothetical protein
MWNIFFWCLLFQFGAVCTEDSKSTDIFSTASTRRINLFLKKFNDLDSASKPAVLNQKNDGGDSLAHVVVGRFIVDLKQISRSLNNAQVMENMKSEIISFVTILSKNNFKWDLVNNNKQSLLHELSKQTLILEWLKDLINQDSNLLESLKKIVDLQDIKGATASMLYCNQQLISKDSLSVFKDLRANLELCDNNGQNVLFYLFNQAGINGKRAYRSYQKLSHFVGVFTPGVFRKLFLQVNDAGKFPFEECLEATQNNSVVSPDVREKLFWNYLNSIIPSVITGYTITTVVTNFRAKCNTLRSGRDPFIRPTQKPPVTLSQQIAPLDTEGASTTDTTAATVTEKRSSEEKSWIQKNPGRVAAGAVGVAGISALVWFLLKKYAQKQPQKKLWAPFQAKAQSIQQP